MITPVFDTSQSQHGVRRILAIVLGALFLLLALSPRPAMAQVGPVEDWRANVTCPAEHQVNEGLLYCTAEYNSQTVHVVVADLSSPSIRFEYLLPQDFSQGQPRECRDPNLPQWGSIQEGGCLDRDGFHHPTVTIDGALQLVKTYQTGRVFRHDLPVAAVINADYGAPPEDRDHGAEGLMVVRGERLDGVSRCDDDYNAALRPWLALGESVDGVTGLIPAAIDRLPVDSALLPAWTYTAFGGGPYLLRNGQVNEAADNCASVPPHKLKMLDPVTNCPVGVTKVWQPPLSEAYKGSCYPTAHTAAGLSPDGRWLFLVINDGEITPEALAAFMAEAFGVQDALKFDGGGSATLWFKGASEITLNPVPNVRPLSNWMAIFAPKGSGVTLPLDATPGERVTSQIILEGEQVVFALQMNNTGPFTWDPMDGVELKVENMTETPRSSTMLPLGGPILPEQFAIWEWQQPSDGLGIYRLQMVQDGKPFGQDSLAIVVTLPKALEDKRDEIARIVDETIQEWRAKGDQAIDELIQDLRLRLEEELKRFVETEGNKLLDKLEQALQSGCGGIGIVLAAPSLAVAWRRRQRRR